MKVDSQEPLSDRTVKIALILGALFFLYISVTDLIGRNRCQKAGGNWDVTEYHCDLPGR